MSIGLLGLLDDVAALTKVAAASLDDIAGMTAKAGLKATGAVIDDAAVTPKYLQGFAAERELPIVARIATGSIKNKMIFLLPAALLLSVAAPWAIGPLLMVGGLYLCYEGAEKVLHLIRPHEAHQHERQLETVAPDAKTLEDQRVASAIKTDFILSAEIMAIALAELPGESLPMQALVLALVAVAITVAVYGSVALIVKADDFGLWLATRERSSSTAKAAGRAIVGGMPTFLKILGLVGTAAMLWVGGNIVLHGADGLGLHAPYAFVHDLAVATSESVPVASGVFAWIVESGTYGLFGLAAGALAIPVVGRALAPAWRWLKSVAPGLEPDRK